MPRNTCPHDAGFRGHVNLRGGHLAICKAEECGLWCFIDADGKVSEYPPRVDGKAGERAAQDGVDSLHGPTVAPNGTPDHAPNAAKGAQ